MYGKCCNGRVIGEEQLVLSSVFTSIGLLAGEGLNSLLTGEGDSSSAMSISRRMSSMSDPLLESSSLCPPR